MAKKRRRRGYYGSRRMRVQRRQKVLIGVIVLVVIGAVVQTLSPVNRVGDGSKTVLDDQVLLLSSQTEPIEAAHAAEPVSPIVRPKKEALITPAVKQISGDKVTVVTGARTQSEVKTQPEAQPKPSPPLSPKSDVVVNVKAPPSISHGDQSSATTLFQVGKLTFEKNDFIVASQKLTKAFEAGLGRRELVATRNMLNQASDQWLFSRTITDDNKMCAKYKVVSGDNFEAIGKLWGIPYQLIMKINDIHNARHLRAGQTIKLIGGPFDAKIFLDRFEMVVYLKDVIVRTYRITIGAKGRETPTGLWDVGIKQENPEWYDEEAGANGTKGYYMPNDPDNPLGDYWIALIGVEGDAVGRKSIGIHGTIPNGEIGTAISRGCVRLHNSDMAELFYLLKDGRSKVTIIQ
jgi:LysM repeat protein